MELIKIKAELNEAENKSRNQNLGFFSLKRRMKRINEKGDVTVENCNSGKL